MIRIKLNDRSWNVRFFDPKDEGYDNEDEVPMGLTKYAEQEILINKKLRYDIMYNTIKHEVVHAYRWSYGCILSTPDTSYSSAEVEELIANFVESYSDRIVETTRYLYRKLDNERSRRWRENTTTRHLHQKM